MKFYVYELIDPNNGQAFYVGKGKGKRMLQHAKNARKGIIDNPDKFLRIKEIHSKGMDVIERIVSYFDDGQSAVDYESELIKYYGINNLTNKYRKGVAQDAKEDLRELLNRSLNESKLYLAYWQKKIVDGKREKKYFNAIKYEKCGIYIYIELLKAFDIVYENKQCQN